MVAKGSTDLYLLARVPGLSGPWLALEGLVWREDRGRRVMHSACLDQISTIFQPDINGMLQSPVRYLPS